MKLIIAIMNKSDAPLVSDAMLKEGFPSTVTNGIGGFLSMENTILITGVEEKRVRGVLKVISKNTKQREETVPENLDTGGFTPPSSIKVGGAVAFVLDVEQFVKL